MKYQNFYLIKISKIKKMDKNIIEMLFEPIMAVLGIGFGFVVLYIVFRAIQMKNKERLSLIEKGMDPSLASSKLLKNKQDNKKNGLILVGVALGIIVGYILNTTLNIPDFVAYSSMILFICGIFLLYYHYSNEYKN